MRWLYEYWLSVTLDDVLIFFGLFLLSLIISFAAVTVVMVKIPADYFSKHYERRFMIGRHWLVRSTALILKNLLGLILIVIGIVLSLPGVPGPGILTILLGLIMLDLPGKRPLESRIIQRPTILSAVNRLRAKYDKPPLTMN
jgi:hypothetical protein